MEKYREEVKAKLNEIELEKIKESMDADERMQQVVFPEEMDQLIKAEIQAFQDAVDDIEPLLESEEDETGDNQSENLVTYRRKKPKKTLMLIAAAVMLLGAGMISSGAPYKWLVSEFRNINEDTRVEVDSEEDIILTESLDENEAYAYAEEVMGGVSVLRLIKIDGSMNFESVNLWGENSGVQILYWCSQNILQYSMIQNVNILSYQEVQTGKLLETYELAVEGIIVTVDSYSELDGSEILKASFVYNNIYYSIKGVISRSVLEEIINNLNFI